MKRFLLDAILVTEDLEVLKRLVDVLEESESTPGASVVSDPEELYQAKQKVQEKVNINPASLKIVKGNLEEFLAQQQLVKTDRTLDEIYADRPASQFSLEKLDEMNKAAAEAGEVEIPFEYFTNPRK